MLVSIDTNKLKDKEKIEVLYALNLIIEKRVERKKGRSWADGIKQRCYLKEIELVSSPTVLLQSLFTTLVIYSYEGRYVATFNVPIVYIQA